MKIAFFDVAEFIRYAVDRIRLFDIKDLFDTISKKEGNEEPIEFCICFDYSDENTRYRLIQEQLVALKQKYETMEGRSIRLINSYNKEMKRTLPDVVILNEMYKSYIENMDNPPKIILAATTTRLFSAVSYIQSRTNVKARIYVPDDIPYLSQIQNVFELGDKFDLDAKSKSVFDKLVIKQIFECLKFSMERGFYPSATSISTNCLDMTNIRKFDTYTIIAGLCKNKILAWENKNNKDGEYRAVTIPDIEIAKKFLKENEIDVEVVPLAAEVAPKKKTKKAKAKKENAEE